MVDVPANTPLSILKWEQLFDISFLGPNKVKPVCLLQPGSNFISYAQNNALFIKGLVAGTSVYDANLFGTLYQQPNDTTKYFIVFDTAFTSIPLSLGTYTLDTTYVNPDVTTEIATSVISGNFDTTTLNVTNLTTANLDVTTNLTLSNLTGERLLQINSDEQISSITNSQITNTKETVTSGAISTTTYISYINNNTYNAVFTIGNPAYDGFKKLILPYDNTTSQFLLSANMGTTLINFTDRGFGVELLYTVDRWEIMSSRQTYLFSWFPRKQIQKLTPTGNIGACGLGRSVTISADGNTIVSGGYADNANVGAVWVYTRSNTTWTLLQKIIATGTTGTARFGGINQAVALSSDGNTLAVGGYTNNANIGGVWVFTRSVGWSTGTKLTTLAGQMGRSVAISRDNTTAILGVPDNGATGACLIFINTAGIWVQQGGSLVGTGNIGNAKQGYSVSLSADGNTAAIGGIADNTNVGATWVFTRSSGVWTQLQKLIGSSSIGSPTQGQSVSVSGDGKYIAVGGPTDGLSNNGAVWIFYKLGSTYIEISKIIPPDFVGGGNRFGYSVMLNYDASYLVAGGYGDNTAVGAAWVYSISGSTVTYVTKLIGTGATGAAGQGYSVAINNDTPTSSSYIPTIAVGGYTDNANAGATWIFTYSGTWTQQGSKIVGTGATGAAQQGSSVALTTDGNTLLVGGFANNAGVGANWVFTRSLGIWSQRNGPILPNSNIGAATAGISSSISGDGTVFFTGGNTDNTSANGAVWYYTYTTGVLFVQQAGPLIGTGATGTAQQGYSVTLSGDGNTLVEGGITNNASRGAIWVFTRSAGVWTQQAGPLVGSGVTAPSQIGYMTSISADGNTVVTGGNQYSGNVGAMWIFTRSGVSWSQQAGPLNGSAASGTAQQGAVRISGNGNTIVLTGNLNNTSVGASWVFVRSNTSWAQQGSKLVLSQLLRQGYTPSITSDGNTIVVGAFNTYNNIGAIGIFIRNGSTWSSPPDFMLMPDTTVSAGPTLQTVDISANGQIVCGGADAESAGVGALWVFA